MEFSGIILYLVVVQEKRIFDRIASNPPEKSYGRLKILGKFCSFFPVRYLHLKSRSDFSSPSRGRFSKEKWPRGFVKRPRPFFSIEKDLGKVEKNRHTILIYR